MGRSDRPKGRGIRAVDLGSGGLHASVRLGGWAEPSCRVGLEPDEQYQLGFGLRFDWELTLFLYFD